MSEEVGSLEESVSVGGEDATSQSVSSGRVDELASLFVLIVLVNEDSQNGTEDLVDHGDRLGILGEDDGRLDVETGRVVS